jgi:hypothetical protein
MNYTPRALLGVVGIITGGWWYSIK